MDRLRRGGSASVDRLPLISRFATGSGSKAPAALALGGAVLALAMLVGLTLTGAPVQAAFPGTNGKIACHGIKDRNLLPDPSEDDYEIYTMNPDGSGMTYLTDNPVRGPGDPAGFFNDDIDPSFSPDGRTIAFTSQRSGGSEIYTMNADGTNVTRLTTAIGEDRANGWSPDGKTIYFNSARDGNIEVYSMRSDGTNQKRLTFEPGFDVFPNGSPDGKKIVFSSNRDGDEELYTMNPDGSNQTRLTTSPRVDRSPNWSPDSKQIVWWSTREFNPGSTTSTNSEIFKMNADGTGLTRLTNSANDPATPFNDSPDLNPSWSPDGTKIVFDSQRSGDPEIYTMNADGSGVRRLTNAVSTDEFCDWQAIPRAAVAPPVYYDIPPVITPRPGAGKLRTSLTLKARPRRDRRPPFRFTFSGRVRVPSGTNAARVCGGRVRLVVKKRRRTVARGSARVSRRCTYKRRITIRSTRRTGRRKARLRVNARFGGNASLKASRRSTTVRIF